MVAKKRACKNCGFLSLEKQCENCGESVFLEKYKGKVVVMDENSIVAEKAGISAKGQFALKYG